MKSRLEPSKESLSSKVKFEINPSSSFEASSFTKEALMMTSLWPRDRPISTRLIYTQHDERATLRPVNLARQNRSQAPGVGGFVAAATGVIAQ